MNQSMNKARLFHHTALQHILVTPVPLLLNHSTLAEWGWLEHTHILDSKCDVVEAVG